MIRQCSVSFAVLFATACSSNLVGATNGTSSGTGATTSAGTTSGNAACCSSACCSEQSTASSTQSNGALICQDGTACYGSWYCQLEDAGGGGLELGEVVFLDPVLVDGVVGNEGEGVVVVTVDAQGTEPAIDGIGGDNLLQFKANGRPNLGQIDSWGQVTHKLLRLCG